MKRKIQLEGDTGESELIQFNWDRNIFTLLCKGLAEAYTEKYGANNNNNNEIKFLRHEYSAVNRKKTEQSHVGENRHLPLV